MLYMEGPAVLASKISNSWFTLLFYVTTTTERWSSNNCRKFQDIGNELRNIS